MTKIETTAQPTSSPSVPQDAILSNNPRQLWCQSLSKHFLIRSSVNWCLLISLLLVRQKNLYVPWRFPVDPMLIAPHMQLAVGPLMFLKHIVICSKGYLTVFLIVNSLSHVLPWFFWESSSLIFHSCSGLRRERDEEKISSTIICTGICLNGRVFTVPWMCSLMVLICHSMSPTGSLFPHTGHVDKYLI